MRHFRSYSLASLFIIGGFFLAAPPASAATMPSFSYAVANPVKGATTTYTFTYTTATDVGVSPEVILETVFPFGFTAGDIANLSVTVNGTPQTIDTGNAYFASRTLFARITNAVPAGSHVVVTVANVVNPSTSGSYTFAVAPYTADFQGHTIDTPASVNPITVYDVLPSYTLSYAPGAHGSLTGSTTQTVPAGGSGTSVTAVAGAGYHFTSWSDASTANPRTDTSVAASATLTASFAIDTHTVTYAASAGGTLSGSASQTVDNASSTLPILAVPDSGYEFTSWSDASTANPRTDANVVSDLSFTAQFTAIPEAPEHHSSSHSGGGSIQSRVASLESMGNAAAAGALKAQYPNLFAGAPSSPVGSTQPSGARDLAAGMSGSDVTALQNLLIAQGYVIPAGATGFFASQTKAALAKYQSEHGIVPAAGYFGAITRAEMKSRSLAGLWW